MTNQDTETQESGEALGSQVIRFAGTVSSLTLVSRVLGLVRDMLCAAMFGIGVAWDAFTVAFMMPNMVRRMFGEGAMASAFIPVFAGYLAEDNKERAWQVANRVLTLLIMILSALVLLGVSAGFLLRWYGGGLTPYNEHILLTQILLPYMIFVCLTSLFAAMLQSMDEFFTATLPPILMNVMWIAALLFICPLFEDVGQRIRALSIVILLAGICQAGMLIPRLWRHGYRPRLTFKGGEEGTRRIFATMMPMVLGLSVLQINLVLDQIIALTLVSSYAHGAVSTLRYGNLLFQLPLALVGIALATASYPTFVRIQKDKDERAYSRFVNGTLGMAFFLSVPAGVGLAVLARPIAQTIFERGAFDMIATARTSKVLACYGIGLWANCCNQILVRAFYARGDHATPVRISVWMVVFNLVMNLVLVVYFNEAGIALATALTAMLYFVLLYSQLKLKSDNRSLANLVQTVVGTLAAAAGMGLLLYFAARKGSDIFIENTLWKGLGVLLLVILGMLVFAMISFALHVKELSQVITLYLPKRKT